MDNTDSERSIIQPQEQHFLTRALLKLQSKVENIEIKILGLSKVIRLLQQYTEKKDQQHEKQVNNMHLFDTRLNNIDLLQTQLTQLSHRYQDNGINFQLQNLKIQQLNKLIIENQRLTSQFDERFRYEIDQCTQKINKIESTILQQIRQSRKDSHKLIRPQNEGYIEEQLTFKINQIENTLRADLEKVKIKVDKIQNKLKKSTREDEYHLISGLQAQRHGKSKSKKQKDKHFSQLKRVRSK